MNGFIDPDSRVNARLDKLEHLLAEAFKQIDLSALDPEVQKAVEDLLSEDEVRQERGRRQYNRWEAQVSQAPGCTSCGRLKPCGGPHDCAMMM